MSLIRQLRQAYHQQVCQEVLFLKRTTIPSIADVSSKLSISLATHILDQIGVSVHTQNIDGQTAGKRFEEITRHFLQEAFQLLAHLRPGQWVFSVQGNISDYAQYQHLAELDRLVKENRELHTTLGDYVVKPDIIISRLPVTDAEINQHLPVTDNFPHYTPLRAANQPTLTPILHASASCKLTLRSDRSQNARTEGLNLIRNRKGHTPHIVVVTAEPMPTRIASLAMGTGDIDCVYHFALPELVSAAQANQNEAVSEILAIMIEGNRLRDIADLPFDLAI